MKIGLWILQVMLALAFVVAGGSKIMTPKSELAALANMAWTEDFADIEIKLIGAAEVLGAIGLIAPAVTGVLPLLTPAAAGGLALLMGGAAATHLSRNEAATVPIVLAVLALIVVIGRLRAAPRKPHR